MSKYANFASSLPMSGEETVSIPMPFLPKENRGHGRGRLMANGRRLVWQMRHQNIPGAENASLRIKPNLTGSLPIYSPLFNGMSNGDVCAILRAIMHWGGVDNKHRQKRTLEWIERNANEISAKLSNAVNLIKDEQASLDSFDGVNLIMNSTMTRIVSLADPEQKLVIYDGRVGGCARLLRCQICGRTRNSSI